MGKKRGNGFWATEAGKEELDALIANTSYRCIEKNWTSKSIRFSHTNIMFRCIECGTTGSTTINNAMFRRNTRVFGCLCPCDFNIASEAGRLKVLEILDKGSWICPAALSQELWKELNPKSRTAKLDIECTECGETASTTLSCLRANKSKGSWCACINQIPWCSEKGRRRFLQICSAIKLQPSNVVLNSARWQEQKISCRSEIQVRCLTCNANAFTTPMRLRQNMSVGCLCASHTVRTVFEYTEAAFHGCTVRREISVPGATRLRYDIAVFVNPESKYPFLAIEVDGYQHFTFPNQFHRLYHQFEAGQKRDRIKDEASYEHDIAMLRIDSETARRNRVDWKDCISKFALLPRQSLPMFTAIAHDDRYELL